MQSSNPGQSYLRVATQTVSPGQLVLMLFDGAIRFLERARLGFGADDPLEFNQTIHNNVVRAQEIIFELNAALNMEAGGELAATLRRLYDYMHHRLMMANRFKKEEGIVEVLGRITVLRDAWAEMLQKTAGGGQEAPAAEAELAEVASEVSLSVLG